MENFLHADERKINIMDTEEKLPKILTFEIQLHQIGAKSRLRLYIKCINCGALYLSILPMSKKGHPYRDLEIIANDFEQFALQFIPLYCLAKLCFQAYHVDYYLKYYNATFTAIKTYGTI